MNSENSRDENRWIELESKIAHQELAIEQLQASLFEYHQTVERMEKSLKQLVSRVEHSLGPEIGPGNQKPPHY